MFHAYFSKTPSWLLLVDCINNENVPRLFFLILMILVEIDHFIQMIIQFEFVTIH